MESPPGHWLPRLLVDWRSKAALGALLLLLVSASFASEYLTWFERKQPLQPLTDVELKEKFPLWQSEVGDGGGDWVEEEEHRERQETIDKMLDRGDTGAFGNVVFLDIGRQGGGRGESKAQGNGQGGARGADSAARAAAPAPQAPGAAETQEEQREGSEGAASGEMVQRRRLEAGARKGGFAGKEMVHQRRQLRAAKRKGESVKREMVTGRGG